MYKQLKGQKGFTLIELMIVVAIIGILAAIAIPNFLTYQMKSRQTEAKENLAAIRTSELSFSAEKGCYIGVTPWPTVAPFPPVAGTKTVPVSWTPGGLGPPPSAPGTPFCTNPGGVFIGTFADIGFAASGNVFYQYAVDDLGIAPPIDPCVAPLPATGAGLAVQTGAHLTAMSNLDGDAALSYWGASSDIGVKDCTVGVY